MPVAAFHPAHVIYGLAPCFLPFACWTVRGRFHKGSVCLSFCVAVSVIRHCVVSFLLLGRSDNFNRARRACSNYLK